MEALYRCEQGNCLVLVDAGEVVEVLMEGHGTVLVSKEALARGWLKVGDMVEDPGHISYMVSGLQFAPAPVNQVMVNLSRSGVCIRTERLDKVKLWRLLEK